jgi:hypothetical protein
MQRRPRESGAFSSRRRNNDPGFVNGLVTLVARGVACSGGPITQQFKIYGFGELGLIGGAGANSLGAGVEYKVSDGPSLYGEGFGRGLTGTMTEAGFRAGLRYAVANFGS